MKFLYYILLSLLSLQTMIASDSLQTNAEHFYNTKNYKACIQSYEGILKEGYTSSKLFYNLGNAYFKNNQIGKAIYNYELAHKIEPNNDDVKTNLSIANERTIDKIESKENFFLGAIKSGLVNYFSPSGWAWLSIISIVICLALAFIFFISKSVLIKQLSFFSAGLFLIVFIGSMVIGFSALNNKQQLSYAIIIVRESKIMDEPNATSTSKFALHDGTKVSVLETNENYTNIKLENGNEGWVKTSELGLF